MLVVGKVKDLGNEESFGTAGKTKRQIVVTTEEQYPQQIPITFMNSKCQAEIESKKVGDSIEVEVNVKGREWINPEGRSVYFLSLDGWKVK